MTHDEPAVRQALCWAWELKVESDTNQGTGPIQSKELAVFS